jgi:hypothetical protein
MTTATTYTSITAQETKKWVETILSLDDVGASIGAIKSQIKTRMRLNYALQVDAKAIEATLKDLTEKAVINKTGQGPNRKYTYNHPPPEVSAPEADTPTIYQLIDAVAPTTAPKKRAFTPSRIYGHDWIGQGDSVKKPGDTFWTHPQATRDGCQDAFRCPSRIGDARMPYTGAYIGQH